MGCSNSYFARRFYNSYFCSDSVLCYILQNDVLDCVYVTALYLWLIYPGLDRLWWGSQRVGGHIRGHTPVHQVLKSSYEPTSWANVHYSQISTGPCSNSKDASYTEVGWFGWWTRKDGKRQHGWSIYTSWISQHGQRIRFFSATTSINLKCEKLSWGLSLHLWVV